ncbi:VCBS repeat-containing protein [Parapusillimonas sp. SGNA-6]|uniref:FG-GAP repeat domain-containing protein n=1 Tax=Parapedobacter sp. SGR-10 TaxID=2710879 RepID=UPI0013D4D7C4|nr:VCBS repeat-containing protein [Parapedobacter sp. SGR-10]NGF56714.1 VCBS repeat-containing protein [Parapedobacter sp. SGR-10]NGM89337.1 VCBS repeat-containing protein [Parapusillimonas sp. SGNA-6]
MRQIFLILSLTCGVVSQSISQEQDLQFLKYNNPGLIVDLGVGLWAWPLPVDYDNDGDMDLVVSSQGRPFNGLYLFENISGDEKPVFAKPKWLNKSVKDIQISYHEGKPIFSGPGVIYTDFLNTYTKKKKKVFDVNTIKGEINGRIRFNQWKHVDYDNDGDLDVIVGIDEWGDYGWDNAFNSHGQWTKGPLHGYVYLIENVDGEYMNRGRLKDQYGKTIDVYGAPTPNMADFDGDGDLDLICGEFLDKLIYFENIGTRENPIFKEGQYVYNNQGIVKMDLEMIIPVAVDWNKDGHVDLIVGDEDGRVAYIKNTGEIVNGMPQFENPYYFQQEADNVKFGVLVTPVSVDWDNDGDEDLIVGNSAGRFAFIENLGLYDGAPRWAKPKLLEVEGQEIRIMAGYNGSIQGPAEQKWGYTTLSVSDWNNDGKLDLIVNSIFGEVVWYENIGTKEKAVLAKPKPVLVDWKGAETPKPFWVWWTPKPNSLVTQWRTTPFTIDWNNDGWNDLIMMDTAGYLSYFERDAKSQGKLLKAPQRIFYSVNESAFDQKHAVVDSLAGLLRLNAKQHGQSGRRKFTIGDWNGDGKNDIIVNSKNATVMEFVRTKKGLNYYKNQDPVAALVLAGHDTSPTLVNWYGSKYKDLLIGAEDGHFYYLKNPKNN